MTNLKIKKYKKIFSNKNKKLISDGSKIFLKYK